MVWRALLAKIFELSTEILNLHNGLLGSGPVYKLRDQGERRREVRLSSHSYCAPPRDTSRTSRNAAVIDLLCTWLGGGEDLLR